VFHSLVACILRSGSVTAGTFHWFTDWFVI
jgi:hypothetical protein